MDIDSDNYGKILLYQLENENKNVNVLFKDESFWLTQKDIADLFEVQVPAISKHLKKIFEEDELDEKVVISKMENTTQHGAIQGLTQTKEVNFYNLDAIIAVGYRVNSKAATRFRIWATNTLKEYIIKGFVLNDDMLKNGKQFGVDYFKELLERIRSIRASERRIYQQITDIFAECSIDYDATSPVTKTFYATIQNKFHYAITGKTAAEIIYHSANKDKDYMGLTTWKNSPNGRILKSDVSIAKNYLSKKEIKTLERTVSAFFDYIEMIIERRQSFTMDEFANSVNKFLEFNEYKILDHSGSCSMKQAKEKAYSEYAEYNKKQPIVSDFDKVVKKFLENK